LSLSTLATTVCSNLAFMSSGASYITSPDWPKWSFESPEQGGDDTSHITRRLGLSTGQFSMAKRYKSPDLYPSTPFFDHRHTSFDLATDMDRLNRGDNRVRPLPFGPSPINLECDLISPDLVTSSQPICRKTPNQREPVGWPWAPLTRNTKPCDT
jgi:hypothetical protein